MKDTRLAIVIGYAFIIIFLIISYHILGHESYDYLRYFYLGC